MPISGYDNYVFVMTCSYADCVEYRIHGDGPSYLVEIRHRVSDYWRKVHNGTEQTWQDQVVRAIGILRKVSDLCSPISQDVVDAFNAWRLAEHEKFIAQLEADPYKYGVLEPDDPIRIKPMIAKSGYFDMTTRRFEAIEPSYEAA